MDASAGPVVLINLFEVPPGAEEGFIAGWEAARDFLAAQDGYRATALHRSLGSEAEFRFVNLAEWVSPVAFQAAPPASRAFPAGSCRSRRILGCTGSWPRTRRPRILVGWC